MPEPRDHAASPAPPEPLGSSPPPGAVPEHRAVGGVIGRYRVTHELGRGGMGVVLAAFDPALGRPVAIKMIGDGATAASEEDVQRFVREARVTAKLRHPGIVSVHEAGAHRGRPYIVMDQVKGSTLADLIARERLSQNRVARIVQELAEALQHAHDVGVLHRDVKPLNVIIDDADGRPRLTDFGLARDLRGTLGRLTMTGEVLGTPDYMAPEQASADESRLGPWTDVWALGAVLYRCLAGRTPFAASSPLAVLQRVLIEEPTPLREVAPDVARDLHAIAMRCLEKDPADRYASAADVAAELKRFIDGRSIRARSPGRIGRVARRLRRRPAAVLSGGAAGLVAIGAVVVAVDAKRGEADARARLDAAQRDLRARADAAERRAADALKDADDHIAELEAAVHGLKPEELASRRQLEDLLVRSLEAIDRSARAAALAREPEGALADRRQAAVDHLARIAFAHGDRALARAAFRRSESLGGDPDDIAIMLDMVDDVTGESSRDRVERVIARARAGELVAGGPLILDEAFDLARERDPETARRLCELLDAVTGEVTDAVRKQARAVAGRAGAPPPAEVDRALDVLFDPRQPLDEATAQSLREIDGAIDASGAGSNYIIATRILEADGRRAVAEVCCRALGRMGAVEAVPSLGRFLAATPYQPDWAHVGSALARIGGPEARAIIEARREILFPDAVYRVWLEPYLDPSRASDAPVPDRRGDGRQ